ncbi:T9SS type A sorting domain-containing protein [bacterium]|nr:T9SS type A sorting domain-containing protein [bacterium]
MNSRSCIKFWFFILFILPITNTHAQHPGWYNYTTGSAPSEIVEDENSIWVSTRGSGIIRLDKHTGERTFYNSANSNLPCHLITCMAFDKQGILWAGTYGSGLIMFDGTAWHSIEPNMPEDNLRRYVRSISINQQGHIWMMAWGLFRFNGTEWTKQSSPIQPSYDSNFPMTTDLQNNLWIGTEAGLYRYDGSQWEQYQNTPNAPKNKITDLAVNSKNELWIATWEEGIYKYDDLGFTQFTEDNSWLPTNRVWDISINKNDKLWLKLWNYYISNYKETYWQNYRSTYWGFPLKDCYNIHVDSEDNVWMAYEDGNIIKFDGLNHTSYSLSNSELQENRIYDLAIGAQDLLWTSHGYRGIYTYNTADSPDISNIESSILSGGVRDICIDSQNRIWAIKADSLLCYESGSWTSYSINSSGVQNIQAHDILADKAHNIWIGTQESGLLKFDGQNWQTFNKDNSPITDNLITCLVMDSTGTIWIGTAWDGILKYDGTDWSLYDRSNTLMLDQTAQSLFFDSKGILWAGTIFGGINRFDGQNWETLVQGTFTSIINIAEGVNGNHWFGTSSAGLFKYNGDTFEHFTPANSGLPYINVSSLATDSHGNLWIGTSFGLAVFNEEEFLLDVEEDTAQPKTTLLTQNYPNPFNASTIIQYQLPQSIRTKITIYNSLGQTVEVILDKQQNAGLHQIPFNGDHLPSGIYYYKIESGNIAKFKKMLLLK